MFHNTVDSFNEKSRISHYYLTVANIEEGNTKFFFITGLIN